MYCHVCKKDYPTGCPVHSGAFKAAVPTGGAPAASMHRRDHRAALKKTLGQGAKVPEQSVRPPGQYLHPALKTIIRKVWVARGEILMSPNSFLEVANIIRAEKPRPPDMRDVDKILLENFNILCKLRELGEKYVCQAVWQLPGSPEISKDIDQVLLIRRRKGISPEYSDALRSIANKGFIWFSGKHPVGTHRLYINAERSHCIDILDFALQCIVLKTECHGIKILPPGAIGKRSDCIVVYLSKGGLLFAKQAILNSMFPRTFFGRTIPGMTERLIDGVGIGSGEEPPQVAIGLKPLEHGDQSQQSFVTFRSELLLAALLDIRENSPDLGYYLYPLFEGRVMEVFRAYGVDPSFPWQGTQ